MCDGCMITDCGMADQIRSIEPGEKGASTGADLHKAMVTAERPREPTEKMVEQGLVYLPGIDADQLRAAWRIMWDMTGEGGNG